MVNIPRISAKCSADGLEDGRSRWERLRLEIKEWFTFVICPRICRDGSVDAKPIQGLFDFLADETNHQWV